MKLFDIARKDLSRTFRSVFSLVMMFGAPLLITGLLYFAFGGLSGGDGGFDLPATRVIVANLDQPDASLGGLQAGQMLVDFLRSEDLGGVAETALASDEAEARSAVRSGRADVALIIPSDLTAAVMTPGQRAAVVLYQDPALTVGPGIVEDLVSHFLDAFAGSKIAAEVTSSQLGARGVDVSGALAGEAAMRYADWASSSEHGSGAAGLTISAPGAEVSSEAETSGMIGGIMAGMLVFFIFFMGASGAESIIYEDEEGTLARLFTTPTGQATILGGKFVGTLATLFIQAAVLLIASAIVFGIQWGQPLTVVLVSVALLVASTGFGIMLMSFIRNSRQTGPVLGGVLTLTGMMGGLFTTGIQNLPPALDAARLVVPQGWAMWGWELALSGANAGQVMLPVGAMLGLGVVFFIVGVALFRRRFAL